MLFLILMLSITILIIVISCIKLRSAMITKIDKNHRILVTTNCLTCVYYQKKINGIWVNHNINGPAKIIYAATDNEVLKEFFFINGKEIEDEFQYLILASSYKD